MSNFIEDIIKNDLDTGKVKSIVTRFPPEPNGCLHIGHAKAACLNFSLARRFGGICNLRFDDTNPVKEDVEFAESIIHDLKWLGFNFNVYYASDYFEYMIEKAKLLISKGLAYVDDISPEDMRLMRGTLTQAGTLSPNRDRPIAESEKLFDDMLSGKVKNGELILRAKIDMASPNMNMRDPALYRVINMPHWRRGDAFHAYPMYDFAHPLEDAYEGVTHSCCTMEFEDHRPLYDWVINNCDIEFKPHQYEFARLNISDTVMSKRYLKGLVDSGKVSGWDDPRMPTLSGLRRRGFTASSICKFIEDVGVVKAVSEVDRAQLDSCLRDELNLTAPRLMAVIDPIELEITNVPDDFCEVVTLEVNPNDANMQTREYKITKHIYIERDDYADPPPPKYKRLTPNGTVRLKGAFIIRAEKAERDSSGNVTKVYASMIDGTRSGQATDVKAKGVIHWVSKSDAVQIKTAELNSMLCEGEGDFIERFNPNSMVIKNSVAEPFVLSADVFQFMRKGYYTRDIKDKNTFICTVSLKDSFNKR